MDDYDYEEDCVEIMEAIEVEIGREMTDAEIWVKMLELQTMCEQRKREAPRRGEV